MGTPLRIRINCSGVDAVVRRGVASGARVATRFLSWRYYVHVEFATAAGGHVEKQVLLDTGSAVSAIPEEWTADEVPVRQRVTVGEGEEWGRARHEWAGEYKDIRQGARQERWERIAAVDCRLITEAGEPSPRVRLPCFLVQDRDYCPGGVLGLLGLLAPQQLHFQAGGPESPVYDAGFECLQLEPRFCERKGRTWDKRGGALIITFR